MLHFAPLLAAAYVVIATVPPFFRQGSGEMLSLKMSRIELKSSNFLEYEELKAKKYESGSEKGRHDESVHMATESHSTPVASAKSSSASHCPRQ